MISLSHTSGLREKTSMVRLSQRVLTGSPVSQLLQFDAVRFSPLWVGKTSGCEIWGPVLLSSWCHNGRWLSARIGPETRKIGTKVLNKNLRQAWFIKISSKRNHIFAKTHGFRSLPKFEIHCRRCFIFSIVLLSYLPCHLFCSLIYPR